MNVDRLCEIVRETTQEFRKGPAVTERERGAVRVVDIYLMPHESEADTSLKVVDVHFMKIGVDPIKAEARREELIDLLNCWGDVGVANLSEGPSYISVGGDLGSQDMALGLFALGEVLGFWKVLTPAAMGIPEGDARGDELAGKGFIFVTGYQRK